MTVRELIARLSELPPDAVALVRDQDGELREVDDADFAPGMHEWYGVKHAVYITGNY